MGGYKIIWAIVMILVLPIGFAKVYSWAPGYDIVEIENQELEHLGDHPNLQMASSEDTENIDTTGITYWLGADNTTIMLSIKVYSEFADPVAKHLNVWIDYNKDQEFTNDEKVVDDSHVYSAGYSIRQFNALAPEGVTYIRATLGGYDEDIGPSGEYEWWGDVEDQMYQIPEFSVITAGLALVLTASSIFYIRRKNLF